MPVNVGCTNDWVCVFFHKRKSNMWGFVVQSGLVIGGRVGKYRNITAVKENMVIRYQRARQGHTMRKHVIPWRQDLKMLE